LSTDEQSIVQSCDCLPSIALCVPAIFEEVSVAEIVSESLLALLLLFLMVVAKHYW